MLRKRRNKKLKTKKVLIILSIIMIIIGGFIIMGNNVFDDREDFEVGEEKNQDNIISEEVIDEQDMVDDTDKNDTTTNVNLEKAPLNNGEYMSLSDGEYLTDKGYTLNIENGIAYIDGLLIVNKTYSLPSSYGGNLTDDVMNAFNLMNADAMALGLNLWIQSGYRSYYTQNTLYNNYVARDGVEAADTYSARPGHSEHQTGLAFDLNTIDDSFTYTDEGKWVNNNCYRYGFIIRYPYGKDNITGYMHESWHLRYVGVDLAEKLYNNGDWITLEEYYGISSSY